ncbi:MAG: GspE/PulE family protein [Planctomycetota bacterium]
MIQSLGEMLLGSGAVTESQLREAIGYQRSAGLRLGEALLKLKLLDESTLYRTLAKQQGLPFVDLDKGKIAADLLRRVPQEIAATQGVVPLMEKGGKLVVAIDDPFKRIVAEELRFLLGSEVACALATPSAHARALERYYGTTRDQGVAERLAPEKSDEESDAPVVRLVTRTLSEALAQRASDVHIEPGHGRLRVRYRVDGMLRDVAEHPEHLHGPVLARLKIMAQMDIAEKRKPQDGRIGLRLDGRDIDVRASILPGNHGETIVLRLLDRSRSLISLKELGFEDEDYAWFRRVIRRPNGIVLVTGPTGSGKTTTLYAALSELNRPDVKILTAEDPVEYHLRGIHQAQVNTRIGLTFARILKAMLRSAPNIILVGEIRDLETAEIAIQASLTGHLVFSTLHTNDAAAAITRLNDLGVKPFLVSAAVQAVIAQRLVRRLCRECAESYVPQPAELRALALEPQLYAGRSFARPRGCRACEGTGYRGRLALFEHLEMDSSLRELVFRGGSTDGLRRAALETGKIQPLLADGARKVVARQTSLAEAMRVTRLATESN